MRKPKTIPAPAPITRALPVATGPLIRHEVNTDGPPRIIITDDGLHLIEALAADGAPQTKIAADLGVGLSKFKKLLAEEESAERMAWERGRAELEHEIAGLLLRAARKGNIIAAIYYSKAQLGWSEQPTITNQVGVQIVLPDSMDRDSFAKRIADRTTITEGGAA